MTSLLRRLHMWMVLMSAVVLFSAEAHAQPRLQAGQPVGFGVNGFHLYSATASAGYFSSALGNGGSALPGLGSDWLGTAGVNAGYSYISTKGAFGIDYSPGYTARVRYSNLDFFNQSLNLHWLTRFNTKWELSFSGTASDSSVETYLFNSAGLGSIVSNSTGDTLNPTLSSGSGAALSPAQLIVYGGRVRTTGTGLALVWRPTTRLRVSWDANGSLAETKYNSSTVIATVPRYISGVGGITLDYSVSPNTNIGTRLTYDYTHSPFTNYDYSLASAYLDQKLGQHWFTSLSGGPGHIRNRTRGTTLESWSYDASGALGYRFRQTILAGTYRRRLGDTTGLGSLHSDDYDGAWSHWSRNMAWMLHASAGKQKYSGGTIPGFGTTYASGSITRSLKRQLSVGLEYSFIRYGAATTPTDFQIGRVTLTWIPLLRDTPPLLNGGPKGGLDPNGADDKP